MFDKSPGILHNEERKGVRPLEEKQYIAIDLKSFYASVECVERGLDPLTANLVVADKSRTDKTICLAVSPALKSYGIPGRPRLFEVVQQVKRINAERRRRAGGEQKGSSTSSRVLAADPVLALDYIVAPPQMAHYMDVSTRIFQVYMDFVSPEDIHVYSIDEVFIDATPYLRREGCTAREFAMRLIRAVLKHSGITATAGIGTNLYLAKVAMDIVAKRLPADADGVRIAELDELSYRRELWDHRPLTDFWRVGPGYARKLEANGLYTMGDIARASLAPIGPHRCEDLLYRLFGVNAELLIDHAWGWEPCTLREIKAYRPATNSLGAGQVLPRPYDFDEGRIIVREMTDSLALDLMEKELVTDQIVLTVSYDAANLADPERAKRYTGPVTKSYYGKPVPKHAHGSRNLPRQTALARELVEAALSIYDRCVGRELLIRRVGVTACRVVPRSEARGEPETEQLDLFTDYEARDRARAEEEARLEREARLQRAVLDIKKRYGKNALLKGTNFLEGATGAARNEQIGGHRA